MFSEACFKDLVWLLRQVSNSVNRVCEDMVAVLWSKLLCNAMYCKALQCIAMCDSAILFQCNASLHNFLVQCCTAQFSSAMRHNVTRLPLPRVPQAVPQPQAPGAHGEPERTKVCHKYVKTYQKAQISTVYPNLQIEFNT